MHRGDWGGGRKERATQVNWKTGSAEMLSGLGGGIGSASVCPPVGKDIGL